jgi:hypothetical protein
MTIQLTNLPVGNDGETQTTHHLRTGKSLLGRNCSNFSLFCNFYLFFITFFSLAALEFELRASYLQGRHSYCLNHSTSLLFYF